MHNLMTREYRPIIYAACINKVNKYCFVNWFDPGSPAEMLIDIFTRCFACGTLAPEGC